MYIRKYLKLNFKLKRERKKKKKKKKKKKRIIYNKQISLIKLY